MIVKSGLVTLKPVNSINTLNPNASEEEIQRQQQIVQQREIERQQKMQQLMTSLENKNTEKKWTVPFN